MKCRLVLSLFLSSPLWAAESGQRTLTHEDLWLIPRVGAPLASPDGKWAVFSVTAPAYDAKDQSADLWIVPLDGSAPARQLTQTKATESGVAWSPDSQRIAFSSKRDGDDAAQIYVLPVGTSGEAERITHLTLGARQPKWSPDGRKIAFVSETYPGCADEAANKKAAQEHKDRKYNARSYETFPIRFWDHWLDEKKAHLFVQEAESGAVAHDLFAGTQLAQSPGFGPENTDEGSAIEAEWTPDGTGIVFTAAINRDEATRAPVRTQIFEVKASGGEPQNLTGDQNSYGQLQFSPDGTRLYATTTEEDPSQVYALTRLAGFPWPLAAGQRRVLTAGFDRSVGRYALASGRIWLTAEESGREKFFSLPSEGGEVRTEALKEEGCFAGLSAGGGRLVGTWDAATHPPEIYALVPKEKTARPLTHFTDAKVAGLALPPLEEFWFTSRGGKRIHSFLVRPPQFDASQKYPLVVLMHGGAANMWRDAWVLRWNYHLLAAPGYVLVLTDYTGSTGYGEKFAREIQFDPLKGPADEINQAADEALRKYSFIDPTRQAAAGASYGGHLANWMEATTTRYRCIVSHAGEADLIMQWGTSDGIFHREVNSGSPIWGDSKVWREQSPVLLAGNHEKGTGFVTPILITVGEQDFRVPMNNAIMFYATQQRLQVPSKLIVFPDASHWILKGEDSRFWYGEVRGWLARWLK